MFAISSPDEFLVIQRSWVALVPHGVEILPKISIVWVGCTNVTDDRRTARSGNFLKDSSTCDLRDRTFSTIWLISLKKKLFESLVKILPWMYLCSALWTRSGLALAQVYALRMLLYIFKYKFVGVGTLGKLTVSAHNRQKLAPSRQARCQILFLWRGSRRQATMTMSSVKVPTCTLILHLSFCSIDQIWAASTPPPLPRLLLCRT